MQGVFWTHLSWQMCSKFGAVKGFYFNCKAQLQVPLRGKQVLHTHRLLHGLICVACALILVCFLWLTGRAGQV